MDEGLERRTLAAEDSHWWYRGRLRVVRDAVERSLGGLREARLLDAGCGGGATLVELADLGTAVGLEPSPISRAKALARGAAQIIDGSLEALPFGDGAFDLALVLDVLEHLPERSRALAELHRVVRPGGALVVTVPAHPRLWSRHDELNHHCRRYTGEALRAQAQGDGWEVLRTSHFMSALLPAAVLARRLGRGADGLETPPAPVNRALEATIKGEAALIRRGARLPVGLSLLGELRRL